MSRTSGRAMRRHHHQRLRNNRKHYYGYDQFPVEFLDRALGMIVHTAKLCSCHSCGNSRHFYGNSLAALTIQEQSEVEVSRIKDWW